MRPIDADKLRDQITTECIPRSQRYVGYFEENKVLKIIAQAPTIMTKDKLLTVIGHEIKELRHEAGCQVEENDYEVAFAFKYASDYLEGVCKLIGDSELLDKEYRRVIREKG